MANKIVVSWVSFNNDPYERERDGSYREHNGQKIPGPTLELLFNEHSPVVGQNKKLYLFVRRPRTPEQGGRSVHPREEDVVKELIAAIKQRSDTLEVKPVYWDTDASPTDHKELFIFTANKLTEIRRENEKAEIIVNISPGTPAAQTALLLALQARFAGDKVRAFQGVPIAKRREPSDVAHEVPWNLLAELAAVAPKDNLSAITAAWDIEHAQSPRLREVFKLTRQYGGVPFPVLIIGERGTGKTEIARKLREGFLEWKSRAPTDWNFHLNCAEYQGSDGNTLRSALFGHERGAFTGADKLRKGLLEEAEDDCVFLDEIHLMDRQAQGLLLLALQRKGSFRHLGGSKPIEAKFRLIAATNRSRDDLRESLAPDFFDRISDLVIELPSLRDCREDLGDIWRSVVFNACAEFAERDSARVPGGVDTLCAEFKPHQTDIEKGICSIQLPGNFRDLEKLARRLLSGGLAEGRYFSLKKDFVQSELTRLKNEESASVVVYSTEPLIGELPTNARCVAFLQETQNAGKTFPVNAAVDEWERRLLSAAKQVCGSDSKAGELLGIQQKTFGNRLNKLGGRTNHPGLS